MINATGILLQRRLGPGPAGRRGHRGDGGRRPRLRQRRAGTWPPAGCRGALRPSRTCCANYRAPRRRWWSATTPRPPCSRWPRWPHGREVIVSRGQLIEIGGGYRLPEVIAASGAVLREVGTTNQTRVGRLRPGHRPLDRRADAGSYRQLCDRRRGRIGNARSVGRAGPPTSTASDPRPRRRRDDRPASLRLRRASRIAARASRPGPTWSSPAATSCWAVPSAASSWDGRLLSRRSNVIRWPGRCGPTK